MTRVGFVLKPNAPEAESLLHKLALPLSAAGHRIVVMAEAQVSSESADIVPAADFHTAIDLAVVLGGDGTMLGASNSVADSGVPVLGINLGRLGFLTPFDPESAETAISKAIAGELELVERMRLQADFRPASGEPSTRTALNDVVIHQGAMARLVHIDAKLDDDVIDSYRADGLIIATPTGSTAYNLAAGGPVVMPGRAAIALTPICAHALTNRPLVIPADRTITTTLGGESRGVILTIDGHWAHSFNPGDVLQISTSPNPLRLYQSDKGYFDILREKLHWGARTT